MRKTLTAVLATAVVGGLGLSASPAGAAETKGLHEAEVTFCDSPDYEVCEPNDVTSHEVLREGVHLRSTSYAGYTSGTFDLDTTTLADVPNASLEWEGSTGEPGIRISGDFDGDDRRDTLWGEKVYAGEWWLDESSSQAVKSKAEEAEMTGGGHGSDWHGTLDEWANLYENGTVEQGGYTLGVPADGILRSLTYGDTTYTFINDPSVTSKVHENDIRPDETTYPGWHQGAKDGAQNYQVRNDGLQLTDKAQVIYGYDESDFAAERPNLALDKALENASYTVEKGQTWFQVPLRFDYVQGEDPRFTTLRPVEPAGPGEHVIELTDMWRSSRPFMDIPAGTPRPLSDFVTAAGTNYNVLGFGVFTDTLGEATVSQITWDDTRYEFVNRAPRAPKVTLETKARKAVKVELPQTDRDGNALTYEIDQPVNGDAELNQAGTKVKYSPNKNFTGKDRFGYTVDDGRGKSSTGKVVVRVAKLEAHITDVTVKPKKITPKKRARVTVRVKADGDAATGKVMVRKGGKVYGLKKLNDGKATIKIAKLERGKHRLTAKYLGNKVTKKDAKRFTIRVVRR